MNLKLRMQRNQYGVYNLQSQRKRRIWNEITMCTTYVSTKDAVCAYLGTQRLRLNWTKTLHIGLTSHANSEFLNTRKKGSRHSVT